MNRTILEVIFAFVILFSIVIVGIVLIDTEDEKADDKLYTFPILIGKKTYAIDVRSNYSVSEASYFGTLKYVSVYFRGSSRATVLCNITFPADLIWGEISVYKQGFKQSDNDYIISSNGTHHSVQMTFNHIATVEIISIKGTEGVNS